MDLAVYGPSPNLNIFNGPFMVDMSAFSSKLMPWANLGSASYPFLHLPGPCSGPLPSALVARKSKYRGVTWDKRDRRWRVRINCLGVQHHVGRYVEEVQAAMVYDKVSYLLYGDDAITNFGVQAAQADGTPVPSTMLQLKARYDRWCSLQQAAAQAGGSAQLMGQMGPKTKHQVATDGAGSVDAVCIPSYHAASPFLKVQANGYQALDGLQLVSSPNLTTVGDSSSNGEQGSGMILPGSCGSAALVAGHSPQLLPAASAGHLLLAKPPSPTLQIEPASKAGAIQAELLVASHPPGMLPTDVSSCFMQQQQALLLPEPQFGTFSANLASMQQYFWGPAINDPTPTSGGSAVSPSAMHTQLNELQEQLSLMQLAQGLIDGQIAATSGGAPLRGFSLLAHGLAIRAGGEGAMAADWSWAIQAGQYA